MHQSKNKIENSTNRYYFAIYILIIINLNFEYK